MLRLLRLKFFIFNQPITTSTDMVSVKILLRDLNTKYKIMRNSLRDLVQFFYTMLRTVVCKYLFLHLNVYVLGTFFTENVEVSVSPFQCLRTRGVLHRKCSENMKQRWVLQKFIIVFLFTLLFKRGLRFKWERSNNN